MSESLSMLGITQAINLRQVREFIDVQVVPSEVPWALPFLPILLALVGMAIFRPR